MKALVQQMVILLVHNFKHLIDIHFATDMLIYCRFVLRAVLAVRQCRSKCGRLYDCMHSY